MNLNITGKISNTRTPNALWRPYMDYYTLLLYVLLLIANRFRSGCLCVHYCTTLLITVTSTFCKRNRAQRLHITSSSKNKWYSEVLSDKIREAFAFFFYRLKVANTTLVIIDVQCWDLQSGIRIEPMAPIRRLSNKSAQISID